MKTYQNNTVCLTRVIIFRKRSPILILELIENPLNFSFRIAYISYAWPEEIFFLPGKQAQSAAQKGKNRPVCTYKFLQAGQKRAVLLLLFIGDRL